MEITATEQEQLDKIKSWWKENGKTLLLSIGLVFVLVISWRLWQEHRLNTRQEASTLYEKMLIAGEQGDSSQLTANAEDLMNGYSQTPYAASAALLLVRQDVYQSNAKEALLHLDWVLANSKWPALREIARVNIARINSSEKNWDKALAVLKKIEDPEFEPLIEEVKGDIYMAKGLPKKASEAYKRAIKGMPEAESLRALVEMKLNEIASRDGEPKIIQAGVKQKRGQLV